MMLRMPTTTRTRRSLAVEDLDLARQVGVRLKAARTRAGLTQKALAEPRYTKAYISALENGLIKPSMAALRFLARRLGTVPGEFLADEDTHWHRIEAELRLASGDWQAAADRFQSILDEGPDAQVRVDVDAALCGKQALEQCAGADGIVGPVVTRGEPVGCPTRLDIVMARREQRFGFGGSNDGIDRTPEAVGGLGKTQEAHAALKARRAFIED